MAATPNGKTRSDSAKPKRRRRGEVAFYAPTVEYLMQRVVYAKTHGEDEDRLELLPYIKPKLRSVDLNLSGQVKVKVTIGGQLQQPRAAEQVLDAVVVQ